MNVLILHNIRSVYNVGAIFRTCDASGISKIYLTGYTPMPIDRFKRWRKDFAKAALGAEKTITWKYIETVEEVIKKMKKEEYTVIGFEQSVDAIDYKKVLIKGDTAFLVGNEVTGISPKILKKCDVIAEIPMKGKKESLNVSVAFGIAIFRILNI